MGILLRLDVPFFDLIWGNENQTPQTQCKLSQSGMLIQRRCDLKYLETYSKNVIDYLKLVQTQAILSFTASQSSSASVIHRIWTEYGNELIKICCTSFSVEDLRALL